MAAPSSELASEESLEDVLCSLGCSVATLLALKSEEFDVQVLRETRSPEELEELEGICPRDARALADWAAAQRG